MSLMQYIPQQPRQQRGPVDPPQMALHGADKYQDPRIAKEYDDKRQDAKRLLATYWVEDMLDDLPSGSRVLDVPCGTGRFFPFFAQKGFIVGGVDASIPMMEQAIAKLEASAGSIDTSKFELVQGDIMKLPVRDKSFDASVSVDITRWAIQKYGPDGIRQMLRELQRVTRQRIIFTARIQNHQWAVTLDLIKSALSGWAIYRNEVGSDMDYRVICLRPT